MVLLFFWVGKPNLVILTCLTYFYFCLLVAIALSSINLLTFCLMALTVSGDFAYISAPLRRRSILS